MRYSIAYIIIALFLAGCNKEKKLIKRLNEHSWNIEQSVRSVIDQEGNESVFEDEKNAGSITLTDDPLEFDGVKQAHFVYTNYLGETTDQTTTFYVNEDGTRVGFAGFLCSGLFECDLIFTVTENKKKSQVWTAYGSDNVYFYPPDTYNADKVDHVKWQLKLKR